MNSRFFQSDNNYLKILIPIHIAPNNLSFQTIYFNNVIKALKKKIDVKIFWVTYMPNKFESKKEKDSEILDIHDFKNALEIIEKIKPNIVFAYTGGPQGQIHYSLSLASKRCNVPVVSLMTVDRLIDVKRFKYLKSNISRFFESSIPTITNENKKIFFGKGRFFIYKTLFMINTLRVLKKNYVFILNDLFNLIKAFSSTIHSLNAEYSNTLHVLDNEGMVKPLIKAGFDEKSLVVTGNPLYDKTFKKIKEVSHIERNGIPQILLITSPVVEHGTWTKQERDEAVKGMVKQFLEHSNEMNLKIKIHPSHENLSEYEKIVNEENSSIIIYREGDILDFLNQCDAVIIYDSETTASISALIARKPIVICNFQNSKKDRFLEKGLAIECTNPKKIIDAVKKSILIGIDENRIQGFVKKELFKDDGMSSERVANAILKLIHK